MASYYFLIFSEGFTSGHPILHPIISPAKVMRCGLKSKAFLPSIGAGTQCLAYFYRMELSTDTKNILGLQLTTDPRWVDLAGISLEDILTDHAYCEQKAATSCISLIQRYSDKQKLVAELSPLVTEEWGHFRLVLAELEKRNLKLGRQRRDEYVNSLLDFQRKGGNEEDRFLDQLLTMALIEARSCERFKRLSDGLNDEYLRNFYRRFMESEAGHYTLFIDLAETYVDKETVRKRWKEWLAYESGIMRNLTVRGDRIH
jgi:tRNA 2-(methylsulfanyl)-N6-isopentenyladenosine37 hydroxylase